MGLLSALAEFVRASMLTGAGLLGASWRGLGLALEQALRTSPATLVLFGLGVLALNVVFVRLLRRQTRSTRLLLESTRTTGDTESRR